MFRTTLSIRSRLLVWLVGGLLVAVALAGGATYFKARNELGEMLDHELTQIAFSMKDGHFAPSVRAVDNPRDEDDDFVAQAWSTGGTLLYDSNPLYVLPRSTHLGFSRIEWRGRGWRMFSLSSQGRILQVAQPLDAREDMAASVALRILAPDILLVPILLGFAWFAVGRGLRPLSQVSAELGKRHASSLEPLPEGTLPKEISPLVGALNALLQRLAQAFETQRHLVADAAHELRTPLTAICLQAQVLERTRDAEAQAQTMGELKAGAERATRLVQQILTMARLEPEAGLQPFAPVELADLAKSVVVDYAPLAEKKGIDLGLAECKSCATLGESENLRVLLGNLVDNAIRYTPAGGRVDVRVIEEAKDVLLEVEDTGLGIPEEERERVFDRFYRRLGTDVPGSGLGLSIVKRIAELHRARVVLGTAAGGVGLKVTVRLRGAEMTSSARRHD